MEERDGASAYADDPRARPTDGDRQRRDHARGSKPPNFLHFIRTDTQFPKFFRLIATFTLSSSDQPAKLGARQLNADLAAPSGRIGPRRRLTRT